MICQQCKSENDHDALFCTSCGARASEDMARQGCCSVKPKYYALLLVPVVIALGVVGYLRFGQPREASATGGGPGREAARPASAGQAPAGGCRCCSKGGADGAGLSVQAREARDAALAYWNRRSGGAPADLQVRDRGCHVEIDILQGKKVARSLRYQDGIITEL